MADTCAMWTGTEAYILGGTPFSNQIIRFRPTGQVHTLHLTDMPEIHGTVCQYVPSRNRIYIFGGGAGFRGSCHRRYLLHTIAMTTWKIENRKVSAINKSCLKYLTSRLQLFVHIITLILIVNQQCRLLLMRFNRVRDKGIKFANR